MVLKYFMYGFLLQRTGAVFEASVQRSDGRDNSLDMYGYPVQDIYIGNNNRYSHGIYR